MNVLGIFDYKTPEGTTIKSVRLDWDGMVNDYPASIIFSSLVWPELKNAGWTISNYEPMDAKDGKGVKLADYPIADGPYFNDGDEYLMNFELAESSIIPEHKIKEYYTITDDNVVEFDEGEYKINTREEFIEYMKNLNSNEDRLMSFCPANYIVAPEARVSISELVYNGGDTVSLIASIYGNLWRRLNYRNWDRFNGLKQFLIKNAGLKDGEELNEMNFLKAYLKWGLDGIKDQCISMTVKMQSWGYIGERPFNAHVPTSMTTVPGIAYKKMVDGINRYYVEAIGEVVDITELTTMKDTPFILTEAYNTIPSVIESINSTDKEYVSVSCKYLKKYDTVVMTFRDEMGYTYDVNISCYDIAIKNSTGDIIFADSIFSVDSIGNILRLNIKEAWKKEEYKRLNTILNKALDIAKMTTIKVPCRSTLELYKEMGIPNIAVYGSLIKEASNKSTEVNQVEKCALALEDWEKGKVDAGVLFDFAYLPQEDYDKYPGIDKVWGSIASVSPSDLIKELDMSYYNSLDVTVEDFLLFIDERLVDNEMYVNQADDKSKVRQGVYPYLKEYYSTAQLLSISDNIILSNWYEGNKKDNKVTIYETYRTLKSLSDVIVGSDARVEDIVALLDNDEKIKSLIDLSEEYRIKDEGYRGYILDKSLASSRYWRMAWAWVTITRTFRELSNLEADKQRDYLVEGLFIKQDRQGEKYRNACISTIEKLINKLEFNSDFDRNVALNYAPEIAAKLSAMVLSKSLHRAEIGDTSEYVKFNTHGSNFIEFSVSGEDLRTFLSFNARPEYCTLYYLYNYYVDSSNTYNCTFAITNANITPFRVQAKIKGIKSYPLIYSIFDKGEFAEKAWYDESRHAVHLMNRSTPFVDQKEGWEQADVIGLRTDWTYKEYDAEVRNLSRVNSVESLSKYFKRWTTTVNELVGQGPNYERLNRVVSIPLLSDIKYGVSPMYEDEVVVSDITTIPYKEEDGTLLSYFQYNSEVFDVAPTTNRNTKAIETNKFSIRPFNYINEEITEDLTRELLLDGTDFTDAVIKISGSNFVVWDSFDDIKSRKMPRVYRTDSITISDIMDLEYNGVIKKLSINSWVMQTLDGVYTIFN